MRFDDYAATASMKGLPLSQIKESYSDYLKSVKSSRADMYSMVNKAAQETAAEIVYRRLSGEVEARNVQARSRMTPGERRLTPPWETQDTPDADQIVRWPERMAKGGAVHLRAGEQADIRHGMIKSSVPGRTDQLPVAVPRDSYIVPADVVSGLGQGNSDAGADILEQILEQKLGGARGASGQPAPDIDIVAAGGEFVIGPDAVKSIGGGDARKGHATLDRMVLGVRKQVAKRLTKLAPPKT